MPRSVFQPPQTDPDVEENLLSKTATGLPGGPTWPGNAAKVTFKSIGAVVLRGWEEKWEAVRVAF